MRWEQLEIPRRFSVFGFFAVFLLFAALLGGCARPVVWETLPSEKQSEPESRPEKTPAGDPAGEPQSEPAGEPASEPQSEPPLLMTVYVCGEVLCPDVYLLPEGSRIYEAVAAAGGFSDAADKEWSNLAQTMSDGQMLRIYSREQTMQMKESGMTPASDHFGLTEEWTGEKEAGNKAGTAGSTGSESSLVNLNTASAEQLMTLPGIGKSRAEDIISYRNDHGAFTDISQIKQISGIKDALFAKIQSYITV